MKTGSSKTGWMLLWAFGVPMPVVLLLQVLREVTGARPKAKPERTPLR